MSRRQFLLTSLALTASAASPFAAAARATTRSYARPGESSWPKVSDWAGLNAAVGGRLSQGTAPDLANPLVRPPISNPFWIGDQTGLSQSSGWSQAWRSTPSAYVLAAQEPSDVAAAVRFARAHNVRLVVRGGGHSYLGGSTAPESLMVWTRPMRQVTVHDAFTPAGSSAQPVPAVSLGAGCIWLDAYKAVTTGAGRYVQGGGCTTVGCAGLVQGGGFGSHSKAYGTGAANLLEAEVVTADGRTRVVNASRDPDLFWALKGGGGGTFGVITRMTLATHALPQTFGAVNCTIRAKSPEAYRRLLARFVDLYAEALHNARWGEQVRAGADNRLDIQMVFNGLTPPEATQAWAPLIEFCKASPAEYEGQDGLRALAAPARRFWDADFLKRYAPGVIRADDRPTAAASDFWWAGDSDQVGAYWHGYASAWLPSSPAQAAEPRQVRRRVVRRQPPQPHRSSLQQGAVGRLGCGDRRRARHGHQPPGARRLRPRDHRRLRTPGLPRPSLAGRGRGALQPRPGRRLHRRASGGRAGRRVLRQRMRLLPGRLAPRILGGPLHAARLREASLRSERAFHRSPRRRQRSVGGWRCVRRSGADSTADVGAEGGGAVSAAERLQSDAELALSDLPSSG